MNTQTQEALKMAIEFMGTLTIDVGIKTWNEKHRKEAIKACKEALKNLEKDLSISRNIWSAQEPVGWQFYDDEKWWNGVNEEHKKSTIEAGYKVRNVFTLPPAREWQGLSDDEIDSLDRWGDLMSPQDMIDFARAIEQALKEKNHA